MLRKLLLLLAFLILVAIGLVAAGIVDLGWSGNRADPVEVRINPVEVGTTNTTVPVPVVGTEPRQVQTPTLRVNDGSAQQPAQPAQPAQPQGNAQ
jgi:hypothetical protein